MELDETAEEERKRKTLHCRPGPRPAGPPRPEEPGRGKSSMTPPVPDTFGGSGGYVEAEGSAASAGRYPTRSGLRLEGGGSYGDTALMPRTTNFCAGQVFDDLDPDPNVFVDDVLADLPTVISTKEDSGGLRDSASLRRVGAEAI